MSPGNRNDSRTGMSPGPRAPADGNPVGAGVFDPGSTRGKSTNRDPAGGASEDAGQELDGHSCPRAVGSDMGEAFADYDLQSDDSHGGDGRVPGKDQMRQRAPLSPWSLTARLNRLVDVGAKDRFVTMCIWRPGWGGW